MIEFSCSFNCSSDVFWKMHDIVIELKKNKQPCEITLSHTSHEHFGFFKVFEPDESINPKNLISEFKTKYNLADEEVQFDRCTINYTPLKSNEII